MQVIFHCGLNKAGSTYLQQSFPLNNVKFSENAICYPLPHTGDGNAAQLALNLRSMDERLAKKSLNRLLEQAKKSNADTLLLSTEYMYHQIVNKKQRDLFLELCRSAGVNGVQFVLILRNIYDHCISAYSHRAGVHKLPSFSDWIRDDPQREKMQGYHRSVDGYEFWQEARKLVDTLEEGLISFAFLNHSEDLLSSFSSILGVEVEPPERKEANISVNSVEALILTEFMNSFPEYCRQYRSNSKELKKTDKASDGYIKEDYYQMVSDQIAKNRDTIKYIEKRAGFEISQKPQIGTYNSLQEGEVNFSISKQQLLVLAKSIKEAERKHNSFLVKAKAKLVQSVPQFARPTVRKMYFALRSR